MLGDVALCIGLTNKNEECPQRYLCQRFICHGTPCHQRQVWIEAPKACLDGQCDYYYKRVAKACL